MKAWLTPEEVAVLLATATQGDNGLVCLEIPDDAIVAEDVRLSLPCPPLVAYGDRRARLSPIQYALVRHLLTTRNPIDYDEAREAVWMRDVEEKTIHNACLEVSTRLCDAEIPWEVDGKNSVVVLKPLAIPENPGATRDGGSQDVSQENRL